MCVYGAPYRLVTMLGAQLARVRTALPGTAKVTVANRWQATAIFHAAVWREHDDLSLEPEQSGQQQGNPECRIAHGTSKTFRKILVDLRRNA